MSKSKDSSVSKQVLEYLFKQNRPYSAIDIFNNLHKEHGKPTVVRALEVLAEEQKVKEKTYGKQKIYFPVQSDAAADDSILKMDQEILDLNKQVTESWQSLKCQEAALESYLHSLTTEEVEQKCENLSVEVSHLEKRLNELENNSVCISAEERDTIMELHAKNTREWKKRKHMVMDAVDTILEGYPKSKKALFEEIGMEIDDEK